MIDEKSLRRPDFDEASSVPVVMADGQTWYIPRPIFRNRPVLKAGKIDGIRKVLATDDPAFAALVQAVEETGTYGSIIELAAHMLGRNYDLSDDQLGDLLTYDPADESEETWLSRVVAVAHGRSADFPTPATSA